MTAERRCEACGAAYLAWQLEPDCLLWRCPRCGHVERDLALARARARDAVYGGEPAADRVRLALTYRRMRRRLPSGTPGTVLEIGCGDGSLLRRWAADGAQVHGVEPDPSVVPSDLPVDVVAAEQMPVPDPPVDLVYAVHVVEHLADPAEVLLRARRALRPGGFVYLLTPNASSGGLRVFEESWWMLEDPTHRRFLSPRSAARMLAAAGFDHVRTRSVVTDSLAVEAASLARLGGSVHPRGVLRNPVVRAAAVLSTPPVLLARAVLPWLTPTLEIVGRAPVGHSAGGA